MLYGRSTLLAPLYTRSCYTYLSVALPPLSGLAGSQELGRAESLAIRGEAALYEGLQP